MIYLKIILPHARGIHLPVVVSTGQALALVDEETRRYRPMKNYLEHLPPLDLTAYEVHISEFSVIMCDIFLLITCLNWFSRHP